MHNQCTLFAISGQGAYRLGMGKKRTVQYHDCLPAQTKLDDLSFVVALTNSSESVEFFFYVNFRYKKSIMKGYTS